MPCKLCGADTPLIDSHIIPRSFYKIDPNESQSIKLVSNAAGEHPKRIPIGEYDQIVCEACEKRFSPWDDYANDLLIAKEKDFQNISHEGKVIARIANEYRYNDLKLFLLSLLWRIGASTRPSFQSINLGPFFDRLKELLIGGKPGELGEFSTLLSQFDAETVILNPHYERWDGIRYVRIYLANYVAHVKVDKRSPPRGPLSDVALHPDRPLCVIVRDFSNSAEFRLMKQMVDAHPNLFPPPAQIRQT